MKSLQLNPQSEDSVNFYYCHFVPTWNSVIGISVSRDFVARDLVTAINIDFFVLSKDRKGSSWFFCSSSAAHANGSVL